MFLRVAWEMINVQLGTQGVPSAWEARVSVGGSRQRGRLGSAWEAPGQREGPGQRISALYFSFRACRTFLTISSACSSVRVWFSSRMVSEKATDFLPWTMWVPV